MADFTELKGIDNLGQTTISERLRVNLISFFDWGFINKGGFFNVSKDDTFNYGGDRSRLRQVTSPYHTDGQVWEAFRYPWVWQSGLSTATQPIQVSGVYVGSTFYPLNTTGAFAHSVDYAQGRVTFDTAISTTSTVQVEYTYPWINVTDAEDVPLFRTIQLQSNRVDRNSFLNAGSGDWNVLGPSKLALPLIAVEVTNRRTYTPYQLGLGQYANTDVFFHVLAEDGTTAKKIADIISFQSAKKIFLYDLDLVASQNRFPLTFDGAIASGALTYPDLVKPVEDGGFRFRSMRFEDMTIESTQVLHQNLHKATVKADTLVAITEI